MKSKFTLTYATLYVAVQSFIFTNTFGQTAVSSYSTTTSATTATTISARAGYNNPGGNSQICNNTRTYNMMFGTSYPGSSTNVPLVSGFVAGGNTFTSIGTSASSPYTRVYMSRVNNGIYTGNRFSAFFTYSTVRNGSGTPSYGVETTNGLTGYLNPSVVNTMENVLNNYSIAYGTDNVFSNRGQGNAGSSPIADFYSTGNNVERINLIYAQGIGATTVASSGQLGFLINERGGNDALKVAAITGIDASNNVTSIGTVVTVNAASWGSVGPAISTFVFMGTEGSNATIFPKELVGMAGNNSGPPATQRTAGVFVSLTNLGVAINTRIYGIVIFPNDISSNYLTLSGTPTGTDAAGSGGLDLMSGGMLSRNTTNYSILAQSLSGSVWNDANGNGVKDGTEANISGTNTSSGGSVVTGGNLFANIVDATTNRVVAAVPVAADGTYSYNGMLPNFDYKIILTTAAGTVGSAVAQTTPAGWTNTGENQDGVVETTTLGELSFKSPFTNGIINRNFGIERLPVPSPKTQTIPYPSGGSMAQGTANQQVSGTDAEDGTLSSSNSVVITTVPGNATMLYDFDGPGGNAPSVITAGTSITGFNPAYLSYTGITNGSTAVTFNYAFIDAANKQGTAAPYTVSWLTPLPVKLMSFSLSEKGCGNLNLIWQVSDAVNFSHFEAERSKGDNHFITIGNVLYTDNEMHYILDDRDVANGNYQYRLKMVDTDGKTAYSKILAWKEDCKEKLPRVFPSLTNGTIRIDGAAPGMAINIYGINGQLLLNKIISQSSETLTLTNLAAGYYLVAISDATGRIVNTTKICKGL